MTCACNFATEIVDYRGRAEGVAATGFLDRGFRELLRLPRDNPLFEKRLARIRCTCHKPPSDFLVNPGKPGELWLRGRYIVLDLVPLGTDEQHVTGVVSHSAVVR
jgi:hypothetical protein